MEQNVYEKLFDELLHQYDITLVRYGKNAYRIFSNTYGIDEQTVLQSLDDLFSYTSAVIAESIINDLEEEARIAYGLEDFVPRPWDEALACIAKYNLPDASEQEQKYVKDHEWEIKILDMLCNHLDEVDINHLDAQESTQGQVFYVEVKETYHKLVRVIAGDSGEACELAMQALNYGDIQCDEYKEDSSDVEVQNKMLIEEYFCDDMSEITLINEEGEVE